MFTLFPRNLLGNFEKWKSRMALGNLRHSSVWISRKCCQHICDRDMIWVIWEHGSVKHTGTSIVKCSILYFSVIFVACSNFHGILHVLIGQITYLKVNIKLEIWIHAKSIRNLILDCRLYRMVYYLSYTCMCMRSRNCAEMKNGKLSWQQNERMTEHQIHLSSQ